MFLKKYIWLSAATLLTACDLIDYHPYDGRLDSDTSREINPTNIERIEKVCEGKDTIRFIFMGDTQRSYNETEDFVKYVNQLDSIDFIIHGGDYTEFGLKKEFEWNDDILSKLKVPYVGLIGNHDVIGNGDQVFRKIFGNENFSFVVSDVKFVCLNTNAIEYDYSHPVPDFNFLKNEIADCTWLGVIILSKINSPLLQQLFEFRFNSTPAPTFRRIMNIPFRICYRIHLVWPISLCSHRNASPASFWVVIGVLIYFGLLL